MKQNLPGREVMGQQFCLTKNGQRFYPLTNSETRMIVQFEMSLESPGFTQLLLNLCN